ncbi:MAG: alpha-L-arabinofuranosidase C-terminal domain-containing protein, partial [Duganella sp.]
LPITLKDNPQYSYNGSSIPEISASAARAKDGKLYLALVNTNPNKDAEVAVDVPGQAIKSVKGRLLTAAAPDAHNTFQAPDAIKPVPFSASAGADGKLTIKIPAKAVIVVAVE